ncbi:serine hydrolase domain-containing protein [Frateuria soli]|uniref:serine hydrolase domain-containing protein n=1 Tax=Frateuria soli TaxID=1542730 RepID=UPI001E411DCF|nr:serine hydrolase domain-containing protein [Frateuria soli]UGB37548.1 beta-lactamase family protein [Frateuria soli]
MQLRPLSLLVATLLGMAAAPAMAISTPALPPATASAGSSTTTQSLPPERMKATLEAYRQWLGKLDKRDAVAGLATAIVVDDKVVFEGTIGYANAADKEPVKPDTVFRLASLSKAFATGLAAILVQDGKLAWDTRLVNVLPFFKLKNMPDTQRATVADILGQRLGLPRNTYDNMLEDDVPYEELVRKLDQVDMTCGVGQCYGYQNVAFSLIGDVVYAMTGNFFYKLVDRRIFLPLGMSTASYGRAALESSKSWARPHRRTRRGWVPFEPKENYYRVAPAAGVNASLRDMEKWLIAQMGGRPDVLSPSTLDVLHTPGVRTPTELHSTAWRNGRITTASYALGWRVFTYGGETLVYHAGAVEGYRTMIGFFPKYRTGVVTMWNAGVPTPSGLMPMVFDSLLGLPHVDWAGLEKSVPDRPRRTRTGRHRRH